MERRLHIRCFMGKRECPFCGKHISAGLTQCVFCRETLPVSPRAANSTRTGTRTDGDAQVRRGLLYMLLAAVIGYFAGGYAAMNLPFPVQPVLTTYLSPALFLGGLGLTVHGYYLQHKSSLRNSIQGSIRG
jgi:hypothetical protein